MRLDRRLFQDLRWNVLMLPRFCINSKRGSTQRSLAWGWFICQVALRMILFVHFSFLNSFCMPLTLGQRWPKSIFLSNLHELKDWISGQVWPGVAVAIWAALGRVDHLWQRGKLGILSISSPCRYLSSSLVFEPIGAWNCSSTSDKSSQAKCVFTWASVFTQGKKPMPCRELWRTPALQDSTEAAGTRSCCDLRAKKKEPQVHQSAVVRIVDFAKFSRILQGLHVTEELA